MKCVDDHLHFDPAKEDPAEDVVPCTRGKSREDCGGTMGWDGASIGDNINTPFRIVGVADGMGQLKTGPLLDRERKARSFTQEG